jgi:hypothetical protein
MDPGKKCLLVAVVVVITILIAALIARCARRKPPRKSADGGSPRSLPPHPVATANRGASDKVMALLIRDFEIGNPAAPRQLEAARDLQDHLTSLVELGNSYQNSIASLTTEEMGGLSASWGVNPNAVSSVMASLTSSLDNARLALARMAPSYANYCAVYNGLDGASSSFVTTADSLIGAGRTLQQTIGRDPMLDPSAKLSAVGIALIKMGKRVKALAGSVHRFGVSLDLE